MKKLFALIGTFAGSYAGWAIGERFGLMTAWMLSAVGTGVGLYVSMRIMRDYF
jgi:hypothetical protein